MRFLVALGICGVLAFAIDTPRMATLEPSSGKPGTEITVSGESLSQMTKLYLSDGKTDVEIQASVVEDNTVKFTIPDTIKPGRYGLAILTKDNRMLDQPVKLTVE